MDQMTNTDAFERFERDVHDRIAAGYHEAFSPVTAAAHAPLLAAAGIASGDRVLDVASGPGVLAGKAAAQGAHVTGVDLAPNMVALARRLQPAATFEVASAESLPFPDQTFDEVLCS